MRVAVGVKHVPDTESKIRPAADGASIDPAGLKFVISPYDEYALEAALALREAGRASEVLAVCAGPPAAQAALRQALAMGADRAVLVEHPGFDRADALVRARALAAVVRAEDAGLVLLGKYGVGTDEGQTGPMLAALLDWPHASGVTALALEDAGFRVERPVEGAVEVQLGTLPAVISCDKGLNEPRYPSLKGIMQAKKKPLDVHPPAELGLDPRTLEGGWRVRWEALELPAPRGAGRIVGGPPAEAARELVRLLREEAKVI